MYFVSSAFCCCYTFYLDSFSEDSQHTCFRMLVNISGSSWVYDGFLCCQALRTCYLFNVFHFDRVERVYLRYLAMSCLRVISRYKQGFPRFLASMTYSADFCLVLVIFLWGGLATL
jgi:hypothetical protein